MCGGGSTPKAPKKVPEKVEPPPQPPAIKATAADVNIGSKVEKSESKRKKIGRSQLRQRATGTSGRTAGLGS